MSDNITRSSSGNRPRIVRIPILATSISLGAFLGVSFIACVLFDLALPSLAMRTAWMPYLPGFVWLSFPGFLLGLAESIAYGVYVAVVFGWIFNLVAGRLPRQT